MCQQPTLASSLSPYDRYEFVSLLRAMVDQLIVVYCLLPIYLLAHGN